MCLTVFGKRVRYKKAKSDIVVYKILVKKTNLSPYRDFQYLPNTEYSSVKLRATHHSAWNDDDEWEIEEGLHAYTTLVRARFMLDYNEKVVLFVIPKGTRYVIGEDWEIVAERMITGDLKGIKKHVQV